MPTGGQRCLDVTFEGISWLSVPTNMDTIRIELVSGADSGLPAEALRLVDRRSPFLLKISSSIPGFVICARATAYYTTWNPTTAESERGGE